jgi:catechol 2,3-dioxygenase-like lactoylglutathione lyase family enzyme
MRTNGHARMFFMDFVKKNPGHIITPSPINFRGANVREIATELSRRGFPLPDLTELPTTGSGAFLVMDPDDNGVFFNTHPSEVAEYARWTLNKPTVEPVEPELPLGSMVVCYDVADLEKSARFYQDMGLQLADTGHGTAVFTAIPPHATPDQVPESLRLRLRQAKGQAKAAAQSLAFLCQDPAEVAAEITNRGIEMEDAEEGPAFVDPQGRKVTLLQA